MAVAFISQLHEKEHAVIKPQPVRKSKEEHLFSDLTSFINLTFWTRNTVFYCNWVKSYDFLA